MLDIKPPLTDRPMNLYQLYRHRLKELIFPTQSGPQPDLTNEPVELSTVILRGLGHFGDETMEEQKAAVFPRYPADVAYQQGWVENVPQYLNLANAAFALRYPNHPHAKKFRDLVPSMTDDELRKMLQG